MSGIISSVGLASGLPIQDIIDQLIAVESRPYLLTLQRIEAIQQKRASYTSLNAQLLALKNAVTQFDRLGFFRRSQATSSDPTVLSAIAADGAVEGSYAFRVQSLVTSHQLISNGFADADQTAVGAGTISFEIGNGIRLIDEIGGGGVSVAGNLIINNKLGVQVQVDLSGAQSVQDVLDALTRTFDGLLASKDNMLRSQEDLLSDRAEFLLTLLDGKRARLELRFARLEQSLNALTSQQSALSVLASSAAFFR